MKSLTCLTVLCLAMAGSAFARQPSPPQAVQGTPVKTVSPDDFVNAGLQAAQWIDAGRAGELWEGASLLTRERVSREAFASGVAKVRQPLGALVSRNWVSLHRQQGAESGPLPPGQYVGIGMVSVFAGNRLVHERVTLRLDQDGIWRFTGYVLE